MPKRGLTESDGEPEDERKSEGAEGEEDDADYEIESIVDHKMGYYNKGILAYLVKWKDYPDDQNSWVDQADAEGAIDMIKEYWDTKPDAKDNPFRPKKKAAAAGERQSSGKKVISADELSKKRKEHAAASTAALNKFVDHLSDEESEEVRPPKKKQKTEQPSTATKTQTQQQKRKSSAVDSEDELKGKIGKRLSSSKGRKQAEQSEDDHMFLDEAAPEPGNMDQYMHIKSWEKMVKAIQTVEQAEDDKLKVYFVIQDDDGQEQRVAEDAAVCNLKFPQKIIQFYERHLKWSFTEAAQQMDD